eukprot:5862518-Alexandrium_andersonii.AAC.1
MPNQMQGQRTPTSGTTLNENKTCCKGERTATPRHCRSGPIGPERRLSGGAPPRPLGAFCASAAALAG